jgi:SAM-dependent methyltransferase
MQSGRTSDPAQKEAAYFDAYYRRTTHDLAINQRMFRMYSAPRYLWNIRERANLFLGDVRGRRLLEYGCGIGEEAVYFAKLGAQVVAIDISRAAVELTKKRALYNGVGDQVQVMLMDCTRTAFRDNSFELIHGLGILHHVGLERGLGEVKRLLRPGGRAVFLEHMGNSDFVEEKLKRWLGIRQKYYSEVEAPLKWESCLAYSREFKRFEMRPYYLLGRLRRVMPFMGKPFVRKFDYFILNLFPRLRHFASGLLICIEA